MESKISDTKFIGNNSDIDLKHTEDVEHRRVLKASPFKDSYQTRVNERLCNQKTQRRCISNNNAKFAYLPGKRRNATIQVGRRKQRLKHVIKTTLFKSCTVGQLMGLRKGKRSMRAIKIFKTRKSELLSADFHISGTKTVCSNSSEKVQLPGMMEAFHKEVVKYWVRRYTLFSRFDDGIKVDEEGLFSVTPEQVAKHQAARCGGGFLIDAFTGVGGNAIQFALTSIHVIAIDIDPKKIEYAQHNASIYGLTDNIDFIVGDFFKLAPRLKADAIFLSPPWGGPGYARARKYNIETMLKPRDGFALFKVALSVALNVAFFLPRTVEEEQLVQLSWLTSPPLPLEIEENYIDNKLKAVTAYYGNLARP